MPTAVTFGRRLLIATMMLALSLAIVALRPSPAHAQTVVTVINLPAVVIDNQCNGEPVALSGRLLTVVTTPPDRQRRGHRAVGLGHPGAAGNRPSERRVLPGGRGQRHRRQPATPTRHRHVLQHRHTLLIPRAAPRRPCCW